MKFEVEVDMYADIYPEGIKRSVFIGDTCEPCFEQMESWQDIVDRNVGYYVRPISNTITAEDLEELNQTLKGFKTAAKTLKKIIKAYEEKNS